MSKAAFDRNREIEGLIRRKEASGDSFSEEEKRFIVQYSGSGGLGKQGASGPGVLYEYYTPKYVAEFLWFLADHYGYDGGWVLEPSIATGALIEHAPDHGKVVGFETNPISARICEILYPRARIYNQFFETAFLERPVFRTAIKAKGTWLEQAPFSLVIGNPPFGIHRNNYSGLFRVPQITTLEIFFIYYGLQLLKPGGLLIYVLPSQFLRNGSKHNREKKELAKIADLVDAFRLPPIFSRSSVPVDILVLRKK